MKICRLTPNFKTANIGETVRFYKDVLGFEMTMAVPDAQNEIHQSLVEGVSYCFIVMQRDGLEFMFQKSISFEEDLVFMRGVAIGASVSFYMEVEDLDAFYMSITPLCSDATEIKATWYGTREFYIKDNNGYVLGFSEKVD